MASIPRQSPISDDYAMRFDNPAAYAEWLQTIPYEMVKNCEGWQENDFSGGSFNSAVSKLINGDTTGLAQAEKIIDQMRDAHIFTQGQPIIVNSIIGYIPNVPAVLQGHPEDMLVRSHSENQVETTPLKVFIETTVSSSLSHKELINRGVACLALVMALGMQRPVELYACSFGDPAYNSRVYGAIVKLDSHPLDLGRAVFMLTNPAYCRRLMFVTVHQQADYRRHSSIPFCRDRRDICGCDDNDILIQGGHGGDELMLRDPITWVKAMLKKHGNVQVEA